MHQDKQDGMTTSSSYSSQYQSGTNAFTTHGGASQIGMGNSQHAGGGGGGGGDKQPAKMNASHILVMLLRLRQCCGHLSLLKDVSYNVG